MTAKKMQTREHILRQALALASQVGVAGLTIGSVAEACGLSKSGMFAHFGSKEALQLAVVESAQQHFVREVFQPILTLERGLPRLQALMAAWLGRLDDGHDLPGGCPLMAAMAGSDKRPLDREKLTEEAYLEKIHLTPQSFYKTVRILKAMPSRLPEGRLYLVMIPGPHYVWGFRSPRYEHYLEQLKTQLAPSFTIIDLHGRTTPEMHFLHDGHWNESGHRLVAEILSAAIALRTPQLFQER